MYAGIFIEGAFNDVFYHRARTRRRAVAFRDLAVVYEWRARLTEYPCLHCYVSWRRERFYISNYKLHSAAAERRFLSGPNGIMCVGRELERDSRSHLTLSLQDVFYGHTTRIVRDQPHSDMNSGCCRKLKARFASDDDGNYLYSCVYCQCAVKSNL